MSKIDVRQMQSDMNDVLDRVAAGETVTVCRGGRPLAELRPVARKAHARRKKGKSRPIGLAKGEFQVPPEFFEPLPGEILSAIYGDDTE